MKQSLKSFIWIIVVNVSFLGCSDQLTDKVKISIKSTTQHNADVKISRNTELDMVTIVESRTDSMGNSVLELILDRPMFFIIQIGEKYGELFLSPGDDLQIEEVGQDYKIPLRFSGKGAEANNYVSWVNSNVEKMKWANGRGLAELDYAEFANRFDSIKRTIDHFHRSYLDSVELPAAVVTKLEAKNDVKFHAIAQEFKFYRSNNALNEKWDAQRAGKEYMGVGVPKEFENLTAEIPLDETFLADGMADYKTLLNYYWQNDINLVVGEKFLTSKDSVPFAPLMTNTLIKKGKYPEAIREFLIAFDLQFWFAANGITPETDSVFADFRRKYEKSVYLPALNKVHDEWLAIAPGKPAPEFEGYTVDGKRVSIKDLKGKVVYIDVWATWCGPCVGEIPSSKKLQQAFSKEKNIQFLNVSIDGDKADWEKFIKAENTWNGLHVNIARDKVQAFHTAYKLFGVPDYILIDHLGNIANMKAPRPSEESVFGEIRKLLAQVP